MLRLVLYGLVLVAIVAAILAVQRALGEGPHPPVIEPPQRHPDAGNVPGEPTGGAASNPPDGSGDPSQQAQDPRPAADPPPPPGLAAGWYPDPGTGGERWWDGTTWTGLYR